MKRVGILSGLALGLLGCQQAAVLVYVDLDKVPLQGTRTLQSLEIQGANAAPKTKRTVEITSRPEKVVSIDREHSAAAIRALLESESAEARKIITERLALYYQSEIDEFFDSEYAGLGPASQAAWNSYRDKVRPIFEKYAKERGPLVVSLTVLTEFPNPDELVKIDPEADPAIQARTENIRILQREINALDQRYEAEISKLDSIARDTIGDSEARMNQRVEAKRKEINDRAEREARQQVNVRTDVLNERLMSLGAKRLPARSGASLSVELGAADTGMKGVTSNRQSVVPPADVHRQLQVWLALNGYDLADSPATGRDLTQDFIKWRASLNSKR